MLAAKENENQMMEMEEIEAILEKIWDLHDKLSDAIHSISRTHFLSTIKTLKNYSSSDRPKKKNGNHLGDAVLEENGRNGYVFIKEFRNEDEDVESAVQEAKSLNAIRTALEHLEDQLEFFHTVQVQQRAERDAAIARLEQSRIVLAIRLAEHHGKKYQVIEEALAFVGDVNNTGAFVSPLESPSGDKFVTHGEKRWNFLNKALVSSFNFAKNSLRMDHMGGILGNVALVACSVLALVHLQQVAYKDNFDQEHPQRREYNIQGTRNTRKAIGLGGSPSDCSAQLDVLLARG